MGITSFIRAATTAALAFTSLEAQAALEPAVRNGNELLRLCNGRDESYCLGYIVGIYRGFLVGGSLANSRTRYICVPDGVEMGQAQMVVVKYLRDNPAELTNGSEMLVLSALAKAFPCPRA